MPVYGEGLQVRDWIHVRDHCSGIYRAWSLGRPGEVYNFGGRCELTNLALTHALLAALDKTSSLIRYVKDRPGHDRRYAIDASKIQRELGWAPAHTFEQGIRETVRWYIDHRGWCARISAGVYRRERLGLSTKESA